MSINNTNSVQTDFNVDPYYADFKEHSSGTRKFVADGIKFARQHFKTVKIKITRNSIIDFFAESKMIPHPILSPCTRLLKIIPITNYMFENEIDNKLGT